MKFNYLEEVDVLVIDDFYSKDNLKEINAELTALTSPAIMKSSNSSSGGALGALTNNIGEPLTSKTGLYLEKYYTKNILERSALVRLTREIVISQKFLKKLHEVNPFFKIIGSEEIYASHLLSYYEDGDYYARHHDVSSFTFFAYFHNKPKKFSGGDLTVYSYDNKKQVDIEPNNNRVILFPGCTEHEVKRVNSEFKHSYSGNGRYCYSMFFNINTIPQVR